MCYKKLKLVYFKKAKRWIIYPKKKKKKPETKGKKAVFFFFFFQKANPKRPRVVQ